MAGELLNDLVVSGFGLVFVVAGLYAIDLGRRERAASGEVADTGTTRLRDLEAGPVEVKGTATATGDSTPFESPLAGTEALAAHVEVEGGRAADAGGTGR